MEHRVKPPRKIVLKPRQMQVFEAVKKLGVPTVAQIAEHTGLTERQVQRALDGCVKKGVLQRNKGGTVH